MSNRTRILILVIAAGAYGACAAFRWHADEHVRRAAGIVLATLIMWITEVAPLGIVALAIPVAATAAGLLKWPEAIAAWGDPIIFLFLGAFLLARALDKHGAFDWFLEARWARRHDGGSGVGLALPVLAISGLISTMQNNTAVTAMLLPVVTAMARRTRVPAIGLLALSYGATFGGMATPIGTAPNFIGYAAMKAHGADVSFLSWMRVGVPVWVGTSLIGWAVLALATRFRLAGRIVAVPAAPGAEREPRWVDSLLSSQTAELTLPAAEPQESADDRRAARGCALAAFAVAAGLWLLPGILKGVTDPSDPRRQWIDTYLPESLVPIAVTWVLFLIRIGPERRTVLDRSDFQTLDWDTLFLIAGGLCQGRMLERSGAAAALGQAVAQAELSPLALMFVVGGATVLLSELTSNTATAALMVPIAGSLAPAAGASAPQMIWLVALSASLGFALPVSTPPNAIVYGTRLVPLRLMAGAGILVDLLSLIWVVVCVSLLA
ncbi:MAG TPA: SLC13 family permease [Phycisphaerae bacterium]